MTALQIDLETYSSVDLKKSGVYRYVEAPDFEILLFGYAYDDDPVTVIDLTAFEDLPEKVLRDMVDPTVTKTAFNANFERTAIARHFGIVCDPLQWRCTAVHALALGLPGYLEGVAEVLKLPVKKDTKGKALMKYFSEPCKPTKVNGQRTRNYPHHDPEKWQQYIDYNRQDVVVEREARRKLERFPVPAHEWKLWALDQRINDRGVRLDPELVHQAIACDEQYEARLVEEARELTELENPNSLPQIKEWLADRGLETPDGLGKEFMPALLDAAPDEETRRMLELRQEMSKTSVDKYNAMQRSICSDDRARGLLQFCGANRTGRWCLAENTPVLVKTQAGIVTEKPIQEVTIADKVWDGIEWVIHEGVVYSGDKEVITWDGVTATPEHTVYISNTESMPLGEAAEKRLELWRGNIRITTFTN